MKENVALVALVAVGFPKAAKVMSRLVERDEGENVALVALVAVDSAKFQLYIAGLMGVNEKRGVRVETFGEKRRVMSICFCFLSSRVRRHCTHTAATKDAMPRWVARFLRVSVGSCTRTFVFCLDCT
ncbi:MAG: hypothetical protein JOZ18_22655 [Chloroflexi bacterium]|nr:hypothetical protein [Chloroflexota bacterium]